MNKKVLLTSLLMSSALLGGSFLEASSAKMHKEHKMVSISSSKGKSIKIQN